MLGSMPVFHHHLVKIPQVMACHLQRSFVKDANSSEVLSLVSLFSCSTSVSHGLLMFDIPWLTFQNIRWHTSSSLCLMQWPAKSSLLSLILRVTFHSSSFLILQLYFMEYLYFFMYSSWDIPYFEI